MGTSTSLPGLLYNSKWKQARQTGRRWVEKSVGDETFGEDCLRTFHRQVTVHGDEYGLRPTMQDAGIRLVDTLDVLRREGLTAVVDLNDVPSEEREERFIRAIADHVAYPGVLPAESAARRAAVEIAQRLLAEPTVKRAVEEADPAPGLISDDLFCVAYRFFFGAVIAGFLTTAFTAKIMVAAPILASLPAGAGPVLTKWLTKRVMAAILSPCEKQAQSDDKQRPIVELGRELLAESVRRALGTSTDTSSGLGEAA